MKSFEPTIPYPRQKYILFALSCLVFLFVIAFIPEEDVNSQQYWVVAVCLSLYFVFLIGLVFAVIRIFIPQLRFKISHVGIEFRGAGRVIPLKAVKELGKKTVTLDDEKMETVHITFDDSVDLNTNISKLHRAKVESSHSYCFAVPATYNIDEYIKCLKNKLKGE